MNGLNLCTVLVRIWSFVLVSALTQLPSNIGAAALTEIELQRALWWLACRHHHCESHIKRAFIVLRGVCDGCDGSKLIFRLSTLVILILSY